ncbi:hypothetical protein HNV12_22480 [Methanococcoides sp. SA1]|nr:hypothetical protein [Methanococcoides sp. SA1]
MEFINLLSGCVESTKNTLEFTEEIITVVEEISDTIEDLESTEYETPVVEVSDSLVIGAFNVQVFGVSKADKPEDTDPSHWQPYIAAISSA